MNQRLLSTCIPLALLLAAGCATQSKNDETGNAQGAAATNSSSASARGTPSGSMRGTSGSGSASEPGQRSVYFEFDKASLSPEDRRIVEANAQYLRAHPDVKARVEGNADERGSKEYNLALGQRRAESVTKAMKLMGVSDQRLEAVSYGEEKPRAQGHDEQAWSQNRRSDINY